jgi:hypothetical protein
VNVQPPQIPPPSHVDPRRDVLSHRRRSFGIAGLIALVFLILTFVFVGDSGYGNRTFENAVTVVAVVYLIVACAVMLRLIRSPRIDALVARVSRWGVPEVPERQRIKSDIASCATRGVIPLLLGESLVMGTGQLWRALILVPFSIALFVVGWNRSEAMIEEFVKSSDP